MVVVASAYKHMGLTGIELLALTLIHLSYFPPSPLIYEHFMIPQVTLVGIISPLVLVVFTYIEDCIGKLSGILSLIILLDFIRSMMSVRGHWLSLL